MKKLFILGLLGTASIASANYYNQPYNCPNYAYGQDYGNDDGEYGNDDGEYGDDDYQDSFQGYNTANQPRREQIRERLSQWEDRPIQNRADRGYNSWNDTRNARMMNDGSNANYQVQQPAAQQNRNWNQNGNSMRNSSSSEYQTPQPASSSEDSMDLTYEDRSVKSNSSSTFNNGSKQVQQPASSLDSRTDWNKNGDSSKIDSDFKKDYEAQQPAAQPMNSTDVSYGEKSTNSNSSINKGNGMMESPAKRDYQIQQPASQPVNTMSDMPNSSSVDTGNKPQESSSKYPSSY